MTEVALRRLAEVSYGLGQPPPPADDGVPIIRATNIERGRIVPDGLIFSALENLPLERTPLLQAGEVLVVRSGAYTGDSALVTDSWAGAAPGYDLRVSPGPNLDPRFLAYSLLGRRALEAMWIASSRAAQPHLNAEELGDVPLLLLPRERQRAIADFLDTETARIDALIAKKRRMIDLLDERKAATMLAAAGGRLTSGGPFVPSTLTWLPERPNGWDEVLIRLVAKTGSGHTPSRERPEWWENCTIPWITTGEVAQVRTDEREEIFDTRERISEVGLANSAAVLHPRGTVVLCRTASAGYSAVMGTDMATSQDFATWTCGSLLRPRYLLLCLRAMRPDLLGRLATGSTHKTIYMPDIHALRIPLPPVHEQDRAVEAASRALGPLFAAMARLRQQVALLQEHRQALITAAVTGELEVPGVAA